MIELNKLNEITLNNFNVDNVVNLINEINDKYSNFRSSNGDTLMHIVLQNCSNNYYSLHKYIIKRLIDLMLNIGIDINAQNNEGETVLIKCSKIIFNNNIILCYLIEKGANVNIKDIKGNNALHYSVSLNQLTKSQMLLSDININAINNDKQTPLHKAVITSNIEMINMLLKHGAHVNALDSNNHSPLYCFLEKFSNNDIIDILYYHGAGNEINVGVNLYYALCTRICNLGQFNYIKYEDTIFRTIKKLFYLKIPFFSMDDIEALNILFKYPKIKIYLKFRFRLKIRKHYIIFYEYVSNNYLSICNNNNAHILRYLNDETILRAICEFMSD
jgi:ankyrin repeat protein